MIPKIIHYCWFGRGEKSELHKKCIASWRKYCPDYQIIEWNEDNYDVNVIPYMRDAYKEKKWSFVSDCARLDVVYQNGGIYLDLDVELVASLDTILCNTCFFSIEKGNNCINTGNGFGAEKQNEYIKDLFDMYKKLSFYKQNGELNLTPCPHYTTIYFEKYGYIRKDVMQKLFRVIMYPSDFFCPLDFGTRRLMITENTCGIHWYDASWYTDDDKKIYEMGIRIKRIFPRFVADVVYFLYGYGYRTVIYLKKGMLLKIIRIRLKELMTRVVKR